MNTHDKEDTAEARRLIDKTLEIDDRYTMAHTYMGWVHWLEAYGG